MTTTFSQKMERQPAKCVTAPPTSGPMLKPSIRNPLQVPIASARPVSGAASLTAASVPATANAAPSPCSARAPTSTKPAGASAMISDASANSAMPAIDDRRAPT